MVKLAIRDDDMNFFTKVEDIEFVYRDFNNFPISFAVIPNVTDISTIGACADTKGNKIPKAVTANKTLIKWLKQRVLEGTADVLLHGESHSYKFINGTRYAEMEWIANDPLLHSKIRKNKEELEHAIEKKIICFVAPSNKIARRSIKAVVNNGMAFSGIVDLKFSRQFSLRNLH